MEERQRFEEQSKMETRRIQAMSWGSNGSDEDLPPPKVITTIHINHYSSIFIYLFYFKYFYCQNEFPFIQLILGDGRKCLSPLKPL